MGYGFARRNAAHLSGGRDADGVKSYNSAVHVPQVFFHGRRRRHRHRRHFLDLAQAAARLPDIRALEDYQPSLSTKVFDSKGEPLAEFSIERRALPAVKFRRPAKRRHGRGGRPLL